MQRNSSKQRIGLLIVLVFMLALYNIYTICAQAEENLVKNGSFEEIQNGDGKPAFWETDSWLKDDEAARFTVEKGDAFDGKHCAAIFSKKPNHARYIQKISVEPDNYYKISCYIKTKNVAKLDRAKGANINIETRIETSQQIFETTDAWQYAELYVHAGKDIKEINIALALGGYYGDAGGKAYFDQVNMVKINNANTDNLSPGTPLCKIGEVKANRNSNSQNPLQNQPQQPEKKEVPKPIFSTDSRSIMYLLFIFIIIFLLSRVVYYNRKKLPSLIKALLYKLSTKRNKSQVKEIRPNQTPEGQ